jgi:hypothetical protein
VYSGTEEIDDSSFFPTPELPTFRTQPLKNLSVRRGLCFEKEKELIPSKPFADGILTNPRYFPSLLTSPLEENPGKLLGETSSFVATGSSD